MTHDKAIWLFENDVSIKLMRADNAPLIISFIHLAYKQQNRITYPEKELESLLSDFLFSMNQPEPRYPASAKQYLLRWTELGFLRRYYETDDDPVFDLTPAAENAIKWMDDLGKQEFVGTESRLLHFFAILKELVLKTNTNVYERVKELEDRRQKLELELQDAKQGIIEVFDDTKVRERYSYAEETAKRLLGDFRQVEQNFRDLDREIRERIIKSSVSKGRLLDDIFKEQDYVSTTDQGKSFRAFWEFLMSRQKQAELDSLIATIMNLPQIERLKNQATIPRIKNNLIEAGDKVHRTNDSLTEQLRKFVEQKSLQESKRILTGIERIETLLIEHKGTPGFFDLDFEIDDVFKLSIMIGRPLFTPPQVVKFEITNNELGDAEPVDDILFEQFNVDQEKLKDNINACLQKASQVTLKEIISRFEITKGIAEVIAYYQIASANGKHFINSDVNDSITVLNAVSEKHYVIRLPQIIFNR